MKFRINYEINGVQDSFILAGENIEELRKTMHQELSKRGVDESTAWSEELK